VEALVIARLLLAAAAVLCALSLEQVAAALGLPA
jgi:hypothetical protein